MKPLREWRTHQLMSVRELSLSAGITPKTLTDLEYGRRRPNYVTMRAISAALGVVPHEITEFAAALEQRGADPSRAANGAAPERAGTPFASPSPGQSAGS